MFPMSYIVPTGPAGYYNYSNQSSTTPTPSAQTYTPPYTPPQSTGSAQSYYSTPLPQYSQTSPCGGVDATSALALLIPAQTPMHAPRDNPRLAQFYADVDRWVSQAIPDHEVRYIASVADFDKWMNEVYHPKMDALKNMVASLEVLQQRLHTLAEESCRLGTAAYNFLTPTLEIGDVFDLIVIVERRLEEVFQALLTMDELKINIEADTNASDCHRSNKNKYAHQWEAWKDNTKLQAKQNFHAARTTRKRVHVEKLAHYISTADKIDTPPYEAIMNAVAAIPALQTTNDVEVLGRAYTVLQAAKDQGTYIDGLRFQAHSEKLQQEEVLAPLAVTDYTKRDALLQRQQVIIADVSQQAANQRKLIDDHFMKWGAQPVIRLIEAYKATQAGGQMMQMGQNVATNPANNATAGQTGARYQMPLSWYSNMLTQQHVTNMQIMNNIGGGSTTFHLANANGSIIY